MNSLADQSRRRPDPRSPATPVTLPALGDLYDRYGAMVHRRAFAILGDYDRAEDATQEVFLRAMRAPACIGADPFPWLYRVTTNLCFNYLRDSKRRGQILASWTPEAGVEDGTAARLTARQLLARVPEDLKRVVLHYYVDDLSYDDIAARLGVSRRTIGNRLAAFHALAGVLRSEEAAA